MQFIKSNIVEETRGIILHSVNCQGVMGSGVALALRKKWPIVYDRYLQIPTGEDSLGKLQIVPVGAELYVANGFGQLYYGNDGKRYASITAIEHILDQTFRWCRDLDLPLKTVKIGCGLGGLDWALDVEPIFREMCKMFPMVDVMIYELG